MLGPPPTDPAIPAWGGEAIRQGYAMTPVLTQQRCTVRECGAIVVMGDVEGRQVALNPTWFDVVVPGPDGRLVLTRGLQPHSATCVDVGARLGRHTAAARA